MPRGSHQVDDASSFSSPPAGRPREARPSLEPIANRSRTTSLTKPPFLPSPSSQDQTTETARRKKRSVKTSNRSLVGASLEVIQKKRSEKTEVRAAARDAALREIKERQRRNRASKK